MEKATERLLRWRAVRGDERVRGLNHTVRHRRWRLHVQSEASLAGPVVTLRTQVFCRGTVLASRRRALDAALPAREIEETLRALHRAVVGQLTAGEFDGCLKDVPADTETVAQIRRDYRHAIKRGGVELHVHTVDLGLAQAEIVTEVCLGEQMLAVRRSCYEPDDEATEVERAMQEQHREVLRKVRRGGFDPRLPRQAPARDDAQLSPLAS